MQAWSLLLLLFSKEQLRWLKTAGSRQAWKRVLSFLGHGNTFVPNTAQEKTKAEEKAEILPTISIPPCPRTHTGGVLLALCA